MVKADLARILHNASYNGHNQMKLQEFKYLCYVFMLVNLAD